MVVNEPKSYGLGSSFKGVLQYLLHDKRKEGEQERTTSERVMFSQTHNLATDDPYFAGRIMAATAQDRPRLREMAGIPDPKNPSNNVVYHYVMSWHKNDKDWLTQDEMIKAARDSLKANDLEGHQAIFIGHNDTDSPHVHVVVNRTQDDGKLIKLYQSQNDLSKWALAYRKARGEEHKYCPKRDENMKKRERKREAKKQGSLTKKHDYKVDKNRSYHLYEAERRAENAANDNKAFEEWKAGQARKNKALSDRGKALYVRQRKEWDQFKKRSKAKKDAIYRRYDQEIKAALPCARKEAKAYYKSYWKELFWRQRNEEWEFKKRERRVSGKIWNAVRAVAHSRKLRGHDDAPRGLLSAGFNYLLSHNARKTALSQKHDHEKIKLSEKQKRYVDRRLQSIKHERKKELSAVKRETDHSYEALKTRHDDERNGLKTAWKQRNIERGEDYKRFKAEQRAKRYARGKTASYSAKEAQSSARLENASDNFQKAFRDVVGPSNDQEQKPKRVRSKQRKSRNRSRSRGGPG
ncbi:MAG: relaxase/mobilization nuclease domain-containing protein [Pseudomonadota bacterium]